MDSVTITEVVCGSAKLSDGRDAFRDEAGLWRAVNPPKTDRGSVRPVARRWQVLLETAFAAATAERYRIGEQSVAAKHRAEFEAELWSTARPNCRCSFCRALADHGRRMATIRGMD